MQVLLGMCQSPQIQDKGMGSSVPVDSPLSLLFLSLFCYLHIVAGWKTMFNVFNAKKKTRCLHFWMSESSKSGWCLLVFLWHSSFPVGNNDLIKAKVKWPASVFQNTYASMPCHAWLEFHEPSDATATLRSPCCPNSSLNSLLIPSKPQVSWMVFADALLMTSDQYFHTPYSLSVRMDP